MSRLRPLRGWKRFIFLSLILIVAAAAAIAITKAVLDARYYSGYEAAAPLQTVVYEEASEDSIRRVDFSFDGYPGERVPSLLLLPPGERAPHPCIIFLHGIGQDKNFLPRIADSFLEAGFAIVSFDQYMRGERKLDEPSRLAEAWGLRRRGAATVIDTRRLLDYLSSRPDIAADRLYLMGASYGAITGATAAAMDDRIRGSVLIYGGGNTRKLLSSPLMRNELGCWHEPAALFGQWLLGVADPCRHASGISPRPVLFLNGTDDTLVTAAAARALHAAAEEPKDIVWLPGDHIGTDPAIVEEAIHESVTWLLKVDEQ
jgi:dienelactone hydrolase